MVLYEYPFNESIRTMLRLEHLFSRLDTLAARDAPMDHHFALVSIFEIMDVASRADLKSDLLKELERHKNQLLAYRGNPNVSEAALDEVVARIDRVHLGLNKFAGKAGQSLTANDWLMSIRSRISIPGGTCEFDLPAYYAWQQYSPERRRADLSHWIESLGPICEGLRLLLDMLRDSGVPHKVMAASGQYQQALPQGRSYQLLQLRLDDALDLVPEITGHRLMVSVRLMKTDGEGRLKPCASDVAFDLALCT